MSAPALFSSLLKNKAVTILCAVFFFFFIVYLTLDYMRSCMHIIHAHFFITENSVAVTVWAPR